MKGRREGIESQRRSMNILEEPREVKEKVKEEVKEKEEEGVGERGGNASGVWRARLIKVTWML